MKVLILGGAGVFGSRLARLLVEDGHEVIVAGRMLSKLEALASEIDVQPLQLDRKDAESVGRALADHKIDYIVDAAGPFQEYRDYSGAKAAIAHGAQYLDLSDSAEFTAGIAALDAQAITAGVAVLSGVSSVPAISGGIVTDLTRGWQKIDLIETAIMPGNRAPRGVSVMRAILSQVGAPLRLWRAGRWEEAIGWSDERTYRLPSGARRRAALNNVPDLTLFPAHFGADTVEFRAGLELGLMQSALRLWSWLRSSGLAPNGKIFTRSLRGVAKLLEPFGSDLGGMVVRVVGQNAGGALEEAIWTIEVGGGQGPFTPTLAACILIRKNNALPGARAAIAELSRAEIEQELKRIGATTSVQRHGFTPLFQTALKADWDTMPAAWRTAHSVSAVKTFTGKGAGCARGRGVVASDRGGVPVSQGQR